MKWPKYFFFFLENDHLSVIDYSQSQSVKKYILLLVNYWSINQLMIYWLTGYFVNFAKLRYLLKKILKKKKNHLPTNSYKIVTIENKILRLGNFIRQLENSNKKKFERYHYMIVSCYTVIHRHQIISPYPY